MCPLCPPCSPRQRQRRMSHQAGWFEDLASAVVDLLVDLLDLLVDLLLSTAGTVETAGGVKGRATAAAPPLPARSENGEGESVSADSTSREGSSMQGRAAVTSLQSGDSLLHPPALLLLLLFPMHAHGWPLAVRGGVLQCLPQLGAQRLPVHCAADLTARQAEG